MTWNHGNLAAIWRAVRFAERRLRHRRALRVGSVAVCGALGCAIVVLGARKLGLVTPVTARSFFAVLGGAVGIVSFAAWSWRLPAGTGALVLDWHHGLHDRLANALAFAAVPAADRTPFMAAAIEDGLGALDAVRVREAVLIRPPRALGLACALAGVLALVALVHVRAREAPPTVLPTLEAVDLAPDDLEDAKDFLRQLERRDLSVENRTAIEEFNRLIDDIASQRVERVEAFRRMQALEDKFLPERPTEPEALERALEAMGEALSKAALTRPVGSALSENDTAKARNALRSLSKRVRSGETVDKAKLDEVRDALKKAADQAARAGEDRLRKREQLQSDILKRRAAMGDGGSDEERSLLDKKERELERLDRELGDHNPEGQALDRLDRDIEQAAADLMKDLGQSADDLDRGAEDLSRIDQQRMSQQEKEELRQKLQELRELMRQQGPGGKGQMMRLKRFARLARGQGGSQQDGQGDPQSGRGDGQPQPEQGADGAPGKGDPGSKGHGKQGEDGDVWVLGPGGEKMLLLSRGSQSRDPGNGGEGLGPSSPKESGEGHDPNVQGKATNPAMGTEDTSVQGADTGQGPSRSQVILGAAERGFATRRYQKVYTEYHQVAEESLAKDEIPGGYRFYVKRYFQLIRPRDSK